MPPFFPDGACAAIGARCSRQPMPGPGGGGVCRFGKLCANVLPVADVPAPNREMFRLIFRPHETWPVYARDKRQTSVAGGFRYSLFAITVVIEGLRNANSKVLVPLCGVYSGPVRFGRPTLHMEAKSRLGAAVQAARLGR